MFGPILLALPKEVLRGAAYMKQVILDVYKRQLLLLGSILIFRKKQL